jgi:protein-tyrosine kinase
MSLVEQAIARLKNQPGGLRAAKVELPLITVAPIAAQPEEPVSTVAPINIDMSALRANGYLPDKDRDRHFADYYQRIKRPLIDKALAGDSGVGEPRVIMVASAVPGDGKTFTSINLALSMALERDISALLVDSDVSKQHITDIFGLRGRPGLLDAILDEGLDAESLVIPTNVRGLSILPAGRRSEGTAELLSSQRMRKIVATLCGRSSRRILLLDSPPLLVTNEGRALVKIAGQVVLVVRAGETPRQAVKAAIELFDERQAGGLILNDARVGASVGYYGYGAYGTSKDAG